VDTNSPSNASISLKPTNQQSHKPKAIRKEERTKELEERERKKEKKKKNHSNESNLSVRLARVRL
jgi:hypothetical protein